uniref:Putative polyprotein n=1 Tax=Moniliophthora roreri TaxID=221103 RepID=A0A0W0FDA2_MONRR
MPTGVGGYKYIFQAIEPTILWPEARALKALKSSSVAKFIYEELISRFACIPVLSFDGGSEFKGEVKWNSKPVANWNGISEFTRTMKKAIGGILPWQSITHVKSTFVAKLMYAAMGMWVCNGELLAEVWMNHAGSLIHTASNLENDVD